MTAAAALLAEVRRRGARVELADGHLRVRPRAAVVDLEDRIREHATELAAELRASSGPEAWIVVSDDTSGTMRIVTTCAPEFWPDELFRAAALAAVVDERHRSGRDAAAQVAGEELEDVLRSLERRGVDAWLTS